MKKSTLLFLSLAALLTACETEEPNNNNTNTQTTFSDGAYVVSEGPWGGTGVISHIDLTSGKVSNGIYKDANDDVPAGQFIQSIAFNNGKGYVIANGSGQMHIVDGSSIEHVKTIDFDYPRYITFKGNSGYLTEGSGAGKVYKISATSDIVTDFVNVGAGPENIITTDDQIIVANSGGHGVDSSVTFIDVVGFSVDTTLILDYKPKDLVVCSSGYLWVSCAGLGSWDTNGPTAPKLFKIDLPTKAIVNTYVLGSADESVSKIAMNEAADVIFYYKSDGIYAFNVDGSTASNPAIINGSFYGVEVDPETGNIFGFNAKDYASNGAVQVYTASGDSITAYEVGISPNGGVFR